MKKSIIFIAVITICFMSQAQTPDTLFVGDREPTFYYWDTNWFDYHKIKHQDDPGIYWDSYGFCTPRCQPEFARYCYTDTSLRIIGVAAAIDLHADTRPYYQGDPIENMLSEYFRVYEVDSTTDEMIMLASAQWNKFIPRYRMVWKTETTILGTVHYDSPVYEAYFDSPVIVSDSFYVSTTMFNNFVPDNFDYWEGATITVDLHAMYAYRRDSLQPYNFDLFEFCCFPEPNFYKRKLHLFNEKNEDIDFNVTDTNWHDYIIEYCPFYALFPIIDTGWHMPLPEECPAPTGLSLLYVNNEVAVLTWNGTPAHQWQLAIARDGSGPENGTVYPCTSDLRAVTGLDTATWYTAWVRSICDNDSVSPWSDSVQFYVPSQPDGPISIGSANDAFVNIMPNPAKGLLNVFSSYRMERIDIYTVTGSLAMSVDVSANGASVDISSLPAGNYLVRIYSTNGTSTKRLVVK